MATLSIHVPILAIATSSVPIIGTSLIMISAVYSYFFNMLISAVHGYPSIC